MISKYTIGHTFKSTPMNGPWYTAPDLTYWPPIPVIIEGNTVSGGSRRGWRMHPTQDDSDIKNVTAKFTTETNFKNRFFFL